jgi:hypothetical protein
MLEQIALRGKLNIVGSRKRLLDDILEVCVCSSNAG